MQVRKELVETYRVDELMTIASAFAWRLFISLDFRFEKRTGEVACFSYRHISLLLCEFIEHHFHLAILYNGIIPVWTG